MEKTTEIKISEYDEKGNKIDYDVIMIYDSDVTDKRYVFYTDGKLNSNGQAGIRVGFAEENNGNVTITSITNPIEQQMLARVYEDNIRNNKK